MKDKSNKEQDETKAKTDAEAEAQKKKDEKILFPDDKKKTADAEK